MDSIVLKRVEVKELFDRFNYNIDFVSNENVSVLIAPNGCGKTTIFNLIHFLLNPTKDTLNDISMVPFSSFSCEFSNDKKLILQKRAIEKENNRNSAEMRLPQMLFGGNWDFSLSYYEPEKNTDSIDFLKRLETWEKSRKSRFDFDDDDDRYYATMRTSNEPLGTYRDNLQNLLCRIIREWLNKNGIEYPVTFISANRLHSKTYTLDRTRNSSPRSRYESRPLDPLEKIQSETAVYLGKALDDYNHLLDEARSGLPDAYINAGDDSALEVSQLQEKWDKYQSELKKFQDIGLLQTTKKSILHGHELQNLVNKHVFLTVYLGEFEKTLQPLQKIYDKLRLFADILNRRNEITGKRILFSKNGVRVVNNGKELELSLLSSGEKHDFVMFYNLIFEAKENSIVLIDEPEISLHIEWQEEYLDRLIEICHLNNIQAIVATHSPNIVNGHFDLFCKKE